MQDKDKDLCTYRFNLANETLLNAKMCLENKFYRDCVNRSYYVVFYAIKTVLALEGIDFKRHKDAVAYFNKKYVSTEIFSKEMGKKIGRIKMMREDADYSDFFIVTEKDARAQYETAENVVEEVKKYLEKEEVF
jgi:uncharacterized protein (UPF0332 family)